MRVFLDTNILLDILMNREPFVEDSELVILKCEDLGAEIFIAWHGLATAYYLLKRGRTEEETLLEIDKILAWARIADATDAHARQARSLGFNDFEDALQATAAIACAADWIITRNTTDFAHSPIAAMEPKDFLKKF